MQGFIFTSHACEGDTARHYGALILGTRGLHAGTTPFAALRLERGDVLAVVRLSGRVVQRRGIGCGSERTVLRKLDAGPLLAEAARQCALDVAELWNAPIDAVRAWEAGEVAELPPPRQPGAAARLGALNVALFANVATRSAHDGRPVAPATFGAFNAMADLGIDRLRSAAAFLNAEVTLALAMA